MAPQHLRRGRTVDRGPPGDGPPLSATHSQPLSIGEIGPNRSRMPDGSMLCRNVPIARTGWMQYAPGEVPLEPPKMPGSAPIIYVSRSAEDLFSEETMRSFIGCAITHEHPPVPVTPTNFAHLGKGFILRTYRGDGPDADCLMADLVIKDRWLMQQIDQDKREVSCGYEADYIQTGDGQGQATRIIGNHLALVEKGRCGPRCAIGDEDTLSTTVINEETNMTQSATPGKRARVPLAEARARVADALADLQDAEEGTGEKGVTVHVHLDGKPPKTEEVVDPNAVKAPVIAADPKVEERFAAIEKGQEALQGTLATILEAVKAGGQVVKEPPKPEEDLEVLSEATMTMDSAALATGYQQFLSQAEILVPGFKLPTFDAAIKRHATVDRMCNGRRAVLGALQASAEGTALLTASNGGKEFDVVGAGCPDVAVAFKAAAAAKAASNNRSSTGDSGRLPEPVKPAVKVGKTFQEINEANAKFWASQGPRA